MPVRDSSIQAYNELKEEGEISENQSKAFEALCAYIRSDDTHRWPTNNELYDWAKSNLDGEEFPFGRFGNFKPRITELTVSYEKTDLELLEYLDEKRKQDSDSTNRKARPVKIRGFQSTLSSVEGESAELREEKERLKSDDDVEKLDQEPEEVQVHYSVRGGMEVRSGPPEKAIEETDDLDSLKQLLERRGLLDEYSDELENRGSEEGGSEESVEEDEDGFYRGDDGEKYVLPPDGEESITELSDGSDEDEVEDVDEDDEEDDESEVKQAVLMEDGEVVG